ncbi:MAG TPA: hypothetical protein VJJ79_01745 [Candidatus Nanoarchaeia archaeon]|nr:hypothetical protein [Candidatus Nanoarchaeia archaeon]
MEYTTTTHFARYFDLFTKAEELLVTRDRPQFGLVIGAGAGKDALFQCAGPYWGFPPEQMFSWEPVELLVALRHAHKESQVTVIDPSPKIAQCLAGQKVVPVSDFWGTPTSYVLRFCATLHSVKAREEMLEYLNTNLKRKGIANRVHMLARALCPPPVYRQEDFLQAELDVQYDVVTALSSVRYLAPSDDVYTKVAEAVAPNGLLLVSDGENGEPRRFENCGLERVFLEEFTLPYLEYCYHAIFRKR